MKMADKENQQKGKRSGRGLGDWESGKWRKGLGLGQGAAGANIDFPATNHHFSNFHDGSRFLCFSSTDGDIFDH